MWALSRGTGGRNMIWDIALMVQWSQDVQEVVFKD